MKKLFITFGTALATALTLTAGLSACTQFPTEKMSVSDMRPSISFKEPALARSLSAQVSLDGAPVGIVSDYLEGKASLRILPGNHALRVTLGGEILLEEKFYVGDGVHRNFTLN